MTKKTKSPCSVTKSIHLAKSSSTLCNVLAC